MVRFLPDDDLERSRIVVYARLRARMTVRTDRTPETRYELRQARRTAGKDSPSVIVPTREKPSDSRNWRAAMPLPAMQVDENRCRICQLWRCETAIFKILAKRIGILAKILAVFPIRVESFGNFAELDRINSF